MTTRLLLAALVLFGLTAFAPAPFPKPARGKTADGVSLAEMQGVWEVTKVQTTRSDGPPADVSDQLKQIEIAGDRWSFGYRQGGGRATAYTIRIDHKRRPPQLDFFHGNASDARPYGVGILERKGDVVRVAYTWGGARAASFERPPNGHWLITLRRAR